MGRGGAIYLSYTALVLLSTVSSTNAGLWDVSIDLGPAPSPEDGPPFSAHASRDRSLLPYQIIGIVASYLGFVLILGTLLLTVGRKARKRAQTMAEQPTEMIKPMINTFDASPRSPGSLRSWGRLRSKKSTSGSIRSGHSHRIGSPGMDSVASFDPNVIQQQKQRAHDDMMRMYGAYYKYEDQKHQDTISTEEISSASPPQYARARPALTVNLDMQRIQTSGLHPKSPLSPTTPRSMRAIYPPSEQYPTGGPISPTHMAQPHSPLRETGMARASSIGSGRTVGSDRGAGPNKVQKSIRGGIRNLKISGPYRAGEDNSDDARTPLSPQSFVDPPSAPEPPTSRTADSQLTPTTPGTGRSIPYPYTQSGHERLDEIRDLPLPYPQRAGGPIYDNEAQVLTDNVSRRPDPTGSVPSSRRNNAPAASVNNQLPFRQYASQRSLATHGLSPMSPSEAWKSGDELRSPTKITELEVGRNRLAGIASPLRSAYEAPTPRTPFTPRFTTRAERKQKEKEEKAMRGVITEEDQVADEKDLWSSGY